jgi:hypothetical protein
MELILVGVGLIAIACAGKRRFKNGTTVRESEYGED